MRCWRLLWFTIGTSAEDSGRPWRNYVDADEMGGAFEMLSMVAGRGEIMSMMNGAFEMLTTMMMDGAFALTDAAVCM